MNGQTYYEDGVQITHDHNDDEIVYRPNQIDLYANTLRRKFWWKVKWLLTSPWSGTDVVKIELKTPLKLERNKL